MLSLPLASALYELSRRGTSSGRAAGALQQPSHVDRLVALELRVEELDRELRLLGRSGWT